MEYRTILVHVDQSPGAAARVRFAAQLARLHGAHLIGAAATGLSRYLPPGVLAQAGPAAQARCDQLRHEAREALARFAALAAAEGVASFEPGLAEDEAGGALALRARYCDLVVVGRDKPQPGRPAPGDLAAYLLLHGGRPVLVVPGAGGFMPGMAAMVAWNASEQACRAVDGAMPLLCAAAQVEVLGAGDVQDRESAVRLALFLQRHGVAARALPRAHAGASGASLLQAAGEAGAGLLVMGGYGKAYAREQLLGGVTAAVLRAASLPILLAH